MVNRSCIIDRIGATPVPGPTKIRVVITGGIVLLDDVDGDDSIDDDDDVGGGNGNVIFSFTRTVDGLPLLDKGDRYLSRENAPFRTQTNTVSSIVNRERNPEHKPIFRRP